jgi:hypothetical protein
MEPQMASIGEAEPRKHGSIRLYLPLYCFAPGAGGGPVRGGTSGGAGEAKGGGVEAPTADGTSMREEAGQRRSGEWIRRR